jgi:hypothetical protein
MPWAERIALRGIPHAQVYMRGKPNVSTFVAEFLKRKDQDAAARSKGKKGSAAVPGKPLAPPASAPGAKAAAAVSEWQKAGTAAAAAGPASAAGKGKAVVAAGGKGGPAPSAKKVAGISTSIPGYSLLSDRA